MTARESRHSLLYSAFAVLALTLQILVLVPLHIYVSNSDEFAHGYLSYLKGTIFPVSCVFGVLLVVSLCVPRKVRCYWVALLFALGLGIYLQSSYLVWDYGVFDGEPIEWAKYNSKAWLEAAIWAAVLLCSFRAARAIERRTVFLWSVLLFLQSSNAFPYLFQARAEWLRPAQANNYGKLFQFSPKRNVVVILLDAFASPVFSRILEERSELGDSLSGFTYFRKAVSEYPTTMLSVPSLLSGAPYDRERPLAEYFEKIFAKEALPTVLGQHGYASSLRTLRQFCKFLPESDCFGFGLSHRDKSYVRYREALEVFGIALFRMAPHFLKKRFFTGPDWLVERFYRYPRFREGFEDEQVKFVHEFRDLLQVTSDRPTFKFLHLLVPHYPIRLDRDCKALPHQVRPTNETFTDQARCAAKLLEELLQGFRKHGVYENSLIVVLADHGPRLGLGMYDRAKFKNADLFRYTVALPILLVKPFGKGGPLVFSDAPVGLSDMVPTVLAELGVEPQGKQAQTLWNIEPGSERVRTVADLRLRWQMWNHGADTKVFRSAQTYQVDGDAWELESWRRER